MGMVNRGADIGWASQFPHENEVVVQPHAARTRWWCSLVVLEGGGGRARCCWNEVVLQQWCWSVSSAAVVVLEGALLRQPLEEHGLQGREGRSILANRCNALNAQMAA